MKKYPSTTGAVLVFVEAHKPGTVGFSGTDAERRRWNQMVRFYVASPAARAIQAPVRPRERHEHRSAASRRAASSSSTSGSDPGSDPEPPPADDGARRLLRRLIRTGLNPVALPQAAALVLALDEAASREVVAA
jgi:hypothetical protein